MLQPLNATATAPPWLTIDCRLAFSPAVHSVTSTVVWAAPTRQRAASEGGSEGLCSPPQPVRSRTNAAPKLRIDNGALLSGVIDGYSVPIGRVAGRTEALAA